MRRGTKQWLLGLATAATAVAAWLAPEPEADGVALKQRAPQVKPQSRDVPAAGPTAVALPGARAASQIAVLSIRSRQTDEFTDAQIFSATQWKKAAPKTEVVVAAPVLSAPSSPSVQAPALPFAVLGRYEKSGQTTFFLQHNDQNLVVRVGDTIDGQYKVESFKGSTLNLRYLPLNQTQSLEVGGSQ